MTCQTAAGFPFMEYRLLGVGLLESHQASGEGHHASAESHPARAES
jgi:hypothetical protein